jgi:hypothetical protein
MTRQVWMTTGLAAALALLGVTEVPAQPLGVFRWQLQPYCNVVSLTVVQEGASYILTGTDNRCGASTAAPATGTASPNPDGSISLGLVIVTSSGAPAHVNAVIDLSTVSGTWRDADGHAGPFVFNGAAPDGPPLPPPTVPAVITSAQLAASLFAGTGTATTVARSDHVHDDRYYTKPQTDTLIAAVAVQVMEACPTLDPTDVMVRVGGVCIDKYEASLWDAPVGGNQITGAIPCAANGQNCTNIYARSVAGVSPRGNITWFQAQQALANSGKRMPTNAEWQAAASGTPGAGSCNIGPGGSVDNTGANSGCISRFQVNDMVGNVAEWVADWVPRSTGCTSWGSFSNNGMCLSGASTTALGPGALVRGGEFTFTATAEAGVFDVYAQHAPYASLEVIGFRGAR